MPLTTEHLAAPLNYWPSTGCISLGTIGAEGETSSKPTFYASYSPDLSSGPSVRVA
jgi:hypothetical protein